MPHDQSVSEALTRTSETDNVDFKSTFDPSAQRDWLELIKDIAAFANSGGGHILVGLLDDGAPSGVDLGELLAVDPADFGNRFHKYTGQHFSGVEFIECEKLSRRICAIRVSGVNVPIVFTRVGETELPDGKKKTTFALGTVYFRHGAKSEPGTRTTSARSWSVSWSAFAGRGSMGLQRSWKLRPAENSGAATK